MNWINESNDVVATCLTAYPGNCNMQGGGGDPSVCIQVKGENPGVCWFNWA